MATLQKKYLHKYWEPLCTYNWMELKDDLIIIRLPISGIRIFHLGLDNTQVRNVSLGRTTLQELWVHHWMKRSSIARSKQNWPCFSRRARRDSNGVANLTNARRSTTGGTDILLGFLGKVSFGLQNKRKTLSGNRRVKKCATACS
jgi:hypothetical protein